MADGGERAEGDESQQQQTEFLGNCMFIVDEEGGQEDTADDEILLYFYPPGVPLHTRVMLNGACVAGRAFVANFTPDPVQVLQLESYTLAFERLGPMTIALSGPVEEPVAALRRRLERIAAWFRFLHGSYELVRAQCASRKELIEQMTAIGDGLVESFVVPGGAATAMGLAPVFLPIPFLDLPESLARHFVAASQLLADIRADPANLAGCVLCGQAILCTQLDVELTDAVLMLTAALSSQHDVSSELRGGGGGGSGGRRASLDAGPRTFYHTVYLTRAAADALRSPPALPAPFATASTSSTGTVSMSSSPDRPCFASPASSEAQGDGATTASVSTTTASTSFAADAEDMVQMGLFVLTLQRVTLAVVMTAEALADTKHTKRIHKLAHADMLSIDSGLAQFLVQQISQRAAENSGGIDSAQSAVSTGPTPGQLAASGAAVVVGGAASGGGGSGGSGSGGVASMAQAAAAQANGQGESQWALFDSLTGALKLGPTGLATSAEQLIAFQSLAGVAHDTLSRPGVSQVYLRRRTGCVLSRKLFSKEMHWFASVQIPSYERFTEFVERAKNASFANNHDGLFL